VTSWLEVAEAQHCALHGHSLKDYGARDLPTAYDGGGSILRDEIRHSSLP
jgi:ferritin-like protein